MSFKIKLVVLFAVTALIAGCASSERLTENSGAELLLTFNAINLDTVESFPINHGKMWTFEYPPLEYFKEKYNFSPSDEWLDEVRLSALRFGNICSASFVSSDGLILTNSHCARESVDEVKLEGENLDSTGFIAGSLSEERKVPGLFVDQLVLIEDVTDKIEEAVKKAETEEEKQFLKQQIIIEMEKQRSEATGLKVSITPLYNGARYSLYGYKTYDDIRLVFAPEIQVAYFGGQYDNFTYPRYNLDYAFFRAYDDSGNPARIENFFTWSKSGASKGDLIFVVGNPGQTVRLYTVAQLQYLRDVTIPNRIEVYNDLIETYKHLIEQNPKNKSRLTTKLFSYKNARKVYDGIVKGLRNPILMKKKKDFENEFKSKVLSNAALREKYGNVWKKIEANRTERERIVNEISALSFNIGNSSDYFVIARDLVELAEELQLPEDERLEIYKGSDLDSTIEDIFPENFDYESNKKILINQLSFMRENLNEGLIDKITNGKTGEEAAEYMIGNSFLTSEEQIKIMIAKGPDAILNSDDPFIYFVVKSDKMEDALRAKSSQLESELEILSEKLGEALLKVYGTSIPPDATFTLRISDGIVKGFPYNGTIAPANTTFYGMYDRYYSFNKEYPWSLPDRWETPPDSFDLSIPFNFVSTNDIIGGNSGSAVINKDREVVGVAFDGNILSLPGMFIYVPFKNRMISVHSEAIIKTLEQVYGANRLSSELRTGKIKFFETVPAGE